MTILINQPITNVTLLHEQRMRTEAFPVLFFKPRLFCVFLFTSMYFCPAESKQGPSEERLIMDLFERYNKYSRPVQNENDSLEVNFGISLQQIIDVVRSHLPENKMNMCTYKRLIRTMTIRFYTYCSQPVCENDFAFANISFFLKGIALFVPHFISSIVYSTIYRPLDDTVRPVCVCPRGLVMFNSYFTLTLLGCPLKVVIEMPL